MKKILMIYGTILIFAFLISGFSFLSTPQTSFSINYQNSETSTDQMPKNSEPTLVWQNSTTEEVRSVAISSDGKYVAVGSNDDYIYLFNSSTSNQVWNYSTGEDVTTVAISIDGTYIVAGSDDDNVYLMNKSSDTPMWSYNADDHIQSVDISDNGFYLVAGCEDGLVYLFNKTSNVPMWNFTAQGEISSVALSNDGTYIVAGSVDSQVYLFNNTISSLKTPMWNYTTTGQINDIAMSDSGLYIAAGNNQNNNDNFYLFSRTTNTPLWIADVDGRVDVVDISSSGDYIVVGTDDERVWLFEKASSVELWKSNLNNEVLSVAISADGSYIVAGDDGDFIHLFDRLSSDKAFKGNTNDRIRTVDISSDGSYFVCGNDDADVNYYSYDTPGDFILSTTASPDLDGNFFLNWGSSSGADNYTLYTHDEEIVDVSDADTIVEGLTNNSYLISGLMSGDYYYILKANNDSTGYIYSNSICVLVRIPPGPFNLETDADDPDDDGTITLEWSASAGVEYYTIYIHDSEIDDLSDDDINIVVDGLMGRSFTIFGLTNGKYYFAVVAKNDTGQTISNSEKIEVELDEVLPSEDLLNPLTLAFIILSIVGIGAAMLGFGLARGQKKAMETMILTKTYGKEKTPIKESPETEVIEKR